MDLSLDATRQELSVLQARVERLGAQQRLQRRVSLVVITALVALWGATAISAPASPLTTVFPDLYQFSPNTPALAAEVNSNFATIRQLAADNRAGLDTKLDKSGGAVNGNLGVNGNLDVNGLLDVGTSANTALRMYNDSDIVGVDIIRGFNDIQLQGDGTGGTDLLIKAGGEVNVKGNLRVEGTILFNRQDCRTVTGGGGRHFCADGEYMNGVDHNQDNDGNIQCCKF
jgi:hypothetical protein